MDDFPNLRALGNNAESLAEKLLKASDGDTQILSRLNSLPDKAIEAFAKDFSQADDILAIFAKEPDLVKAWESLDEVGYVLAKTDIPTLKLFNKVDELGEGALKTKLISKLDDAELVKFSDDFGGAADQTFATLKNNEGLIDYWKVNGNSIKRKTYPNVEHKLWETTKQEILAIANPSEVKILNAIEDARIPSNSEKVMAGAYSPDLLNSDVVIKYNTKTADITALEPEIRQHIEYLQLIKNDFDAGGKLYQKLYSNVPNGKMLTADKAGIHAEVLAVNEVIKQLKYAGKFNGIQDLNKIEVLVKGKVSSRGLENMCRCPHCFHIIDGVKTIGNK